MVTETIRDLYFGGIRPAELRNFENETYKLHIRNYERIYEDIRSLFPNECLQSFDTMLEEYAEAHDEVVIDAFVRGFELGMKLTVAGLSSEKCDK